MIFQLLILWLVILKGCFSVALYGLQLAWWKGRQHSCNRAASVVLLLYQGAIGSVLWLAISACCYARALCKGWSLSRMRAQEHGLSLSGLVAWWWLCCTR